MATPKRSFRALRDKVKKPQPATRTSKTISEDRSCEATQTRRRLVALILEHERHERKYNRMQHELGQMNSQTRQSTITARIGPDLSPRDKFTPPHLHIPQPQSGTPQERNTISAPRAISTSTNTILADFQPPGRESPGTMNLNGGPMPQDMAAQFFPDDPKRRPPRSSAQFAYGRSNVSISAGTSRMSSGQSQPSPSTPSSHSHALQPQAFPPMRPITAQDIHLARQKLGFQSQSYTDDQIRDILRNRQRQILIQTAHQRARPRLNSLSGNTNITSRQSQPISPPRHNFSHRTSVWSNYSS